MKNKNNKMIFTKVLLTLLAAHFSLSEGQVLGPGQREATEQERQDHFKSQVYVEVKETWQPENAKFRAFFYKIKPFKVTSRRVVLVSLVIKRVLTNVNGERRE